MIIKIAVASKSDRIPSASAIAHTHKPAFAPRLIHPICTPPATCQCALMGLVRPSFAGRGRLAHAPHNAPLRWAPLSCCDPGPRRRAMSRVERAGPRGSPPRLSAARSASDIAHTPSRIRAVDPRRCLPAGIPCADHTSPCAPHGTAHRVRDPQLSRCRSRKVRFA